MRVSSVGDEHPLMIDGVVLCHGTSGQEPCQTLKRCHHKFISKWSPPRVVGRIISGRRTYLNQSSKDRYLQDSIQ